MKINRFKLKKFLGKTKQLMASDNQLESQNLAIEEERKSRFMINTTRGRRSLMKCACVNKRESEENKRDRLRRLRDVAQVLVPVKIFAKCVIKVAPRAIKK